jgi:hypothetical protein
MCTKKLLCVCVCSGTYMFTRMLCGFCDDVAHVKVNPCVCHEDIQQEQRYGLIHSKPQFQWLQVVYFTP